MGRTDEVQFMLECVAEWRRLGARVTFEAGWETRGNGTNGNYEGGVVHHTASASTAKNPNPTRSILIHGRSDLSGPLCNVTGPWCTTADPWLHIIAAFPSNHAGASGGKSMGPLPVTGLFNPRVLGLEVDYAGTAPMSGGQRRAALIFTRGLTTVLKRSTEYVRAHAETSVTGKWDAGYASGKTIDMAAFRREAATLTGADMPLTDDDIRRIWEHQINSGKRVTSAEVMLAAADSFVTDAVPVIVSTLLDASVDRPDGRGPTSLRAMLAWNDNHVDAIIAAISSALTGVGPVDANAIAEQVRTAIAAKLASLKFTVNM